MISQALLCVVLVSIIVLTICGNVLVCLAVAFTRRLRHVANCFVVSLAVTDLLLGVLVLPLSATQELRNNHWPLGSVLCNIYLSVDLMLCTASILTLLAISVDRYLAISSPLRYPSRVTATRAALAIAAIWATSLASSFLPIHLGWNTADFSVQHLGRGGWEEGREEEGEEEGGGEEGASCHYEWNNNYVILDAFGIFYIPLLLMCGMYHCIFRVAREQVRRIRATTPSFARLPPVPFSAREHKATTTLAVILGAFVICWFPYFTFYLVMGIRAEKNPPATVHSVVLWLAYFNSVLNPILYPSFNRDFRRAYVELLTCRGPRCRQRPSSLRLSPHQGASVSGRETIELCKGSPVQGRIHMLPENNNKMT